MFYSRNEPFYLFLFLCDLFEYMFPYHIIITLLRRRHFRPHHIWSLEQGSATSTPETNPLIAAALHNATHSLLLRLPEELLLQIMETLLHYPTAIQCLRRTSRVFLRLYCSSVFGHTHNPFISPRVQRQLWLEPSETHYRRQRSQLLQLLDRDTEGYCNTCRSRRTAFSWKYRLRALLEDRLWCIGCSRTHPRVLFSPKERKHYARVCIGREGYVRLCEHKTLNWSDVGTIAPLVAEERHPSAYHIVTCDHESHYPQCHNDSQAGIFTANSIIKPQARVVHVRGRLETLVMEWQGHLLIDTPANQATSPSSVHQQLQKWRKGAAISIAPILAPGRLPEMNCFDPNVCSCLDYTDLEKVPGWHAPCEVHLGRSSCRFHPKHQLQAVRSQSPIEIINNQGGQIDEPASPKSHSTEVQTTGNDNRGTSRIKISLSPCVTGNARCLAINYRREIEVNVLGECILPYHHNVPPTWFQALDPASCALTEDKETYGIFWCDEPGCINYYEYLRKLCEPFRG